MSDFALKEPRTTKWCIEYMLRDGGAVLHHEMWKARRKLQATDFGVEIHGLCANVVELLGTFDQLD
eukprot:4780206-Lingulodinium_polyedra.AAC.1